MKLTKIALAVGVVLAHGSALATNGYFSHGFGIKAKGMAGVGVALPQDAMAAATNPAGMVQVGSRWDVGVDWFKPVRGADIVGSGALGADGSYDGNGDSNFLIPEFGYNKMLSAESSLGITVYGNGGMNTRYKTNPFTALGSSGDAGVNLEQLFIAPTYAMKVSPTQSVGASVILARQQFGATGLQAFDNPGSIHPGYVTDKGNDTTFGWGVRLGWSGQVTNDLTLGATYASKIDGKFDDYKGLFAEEGSFDIPENFAIGFAYKASPKMTVAADVQRINYGDVKSVSNTIDCYGTTCFLGADNGPGFGWQNMTVYKLAMQYDYAPDLTLRAGYSHTKQPIPESQTLFNILAPGVMEDHFTLGATKKLQDKSEVSFSYMHAFKKEVNGSGSMAVLSGNPGEANLHMSQDSLGIAYGKSF